MDDRTGNCFRRRTNDELMIVVEKYSIVIPVFNSAMCIDDLTSRIIHVMESNNFEYELIFVDDGSIDNSWLTIKIIKEKYPDRIRAIKLSRNFGQHNATICGINHAGGNYIITIDDDLEYNPDDIPTLIETIKNKDSDVVYGVGKQSKSLIRHLLSMIILFIVRKINGENTARGSSFRIIRVELAKRIAGHSNHFSMIDEFITWYTEKVSFISITREKSKKQKSGYSVVGLSKMVLETIVFSSSLPLKIIRKIGLYMILFNFFWTLLIVYRKIFHSVSVEGYTSLLIAILFSTGFLILCFSIIAEYLHKTIMIAYKRPVYNEDVVL